MKNNEIPFGVSHELAPLSDGMSFGGAATLRNVESRSGDEKRIETFSIGTGAGDYWIQVNNSLIDSNNMLAEYSSASLRYCISGGFERKYPKTTRALAELYNTMREEMFLIENS